MRPGRLIYIPLCFYFIGYETPIEYHMTHLHSTMLLLYPYMEIGQEVKVALFTFHYASTLSRMDSGDPQLFVDLHSTMLLLYLMRVVMTFGSIHHLHSTMLLLYHSRKLTVLTF